MKEKEKENKKPGKESWRKARRIFSFLGPYRSLYAASFFFLILSSVTAMAFPWLMGKLFGATSAGTASDLSDLTNANSVVLLLFIVFGAQSIFSFLRIYLGSKVTEGVLTDMRQYAYERMVTFPISFFHRNKVGELTSRISADISLLQETFNTTISEFIRQFIVIIIGVSALAVLSWKLSLIMLATVPVMAIVAVFFGRFIKKLSKESQDKIAESNLVVEETLSSILSVKAFANEWLEVVRYRKATNEAKNLSIKGAIWRGAFVSFIIFCMFGSIVFVVWQGVLMTQNGDLLPEELVSFIMFSIFIGASFGSIPELYAKIQRAVGATERLMDILEEETEAIQLKQKDEAKRVLSGTVSFRNVSFHYPSRNDFPVLKQVSFEVQKGEQVALVGPSGSGKSTLASLVLRLFDPIEGTILFDGKDAREFDLHELRSSMAIVPQDVILFGGTIRENIAYGKPGASDQEIRQAAEKANAWEFVQRFPEGLDTLVGDRGVQLSGGQRQRIAIARAVLKDPAILILDEATSSLDSESEQLVQGALEKLMEGRTSLVIAHRLSTIRKSSKILVLKDGVIEETGSHEELLANAEGLYHKLSKMQGIF